MIMLRTVKTMTTLSRRIIVGKVMIVIESIIKFLSGVLQCLLMTVMPLQRMSYQPTLFPLRLRAHFGGPCLSTAGLSLLSLELCPFHDQQWSTCCSVSFFPNPKVFGRILSFCFDGAVHVCTWWVQRVKGQVKTALKAPPVSGDLS